MEYPVMDHGNMIGICVLEEEGLYWNITCVCQPVSDQIERLYCGTTRLGVLFLEGDHLTLRRRVSKSSVPMLPPSWGMFTLSPVLEPTPWEGELAGVSCKGFQKGDLLLFPYRRDQPCPCEPLFCFFEIRDGFWQIPNKKEWQQI